MFTVLYMYSCFFALNFFDMLSVLYASGFIAVVVVVFKTYDMLTVLYMQADVSLPKRKHLTKMSLVRANPNVLQSTHLQLSQRL